MAQEGETPKALASRPELEPHLVLFWQAFSELNTTRAASFGAAPCPIPWTAMDAWAKRHSLSAAQFDRLVSAIAAMDVAYIDYFTKGET